MASNKIEDLIKRGEERGFVFQGIPTTALDWDNIFQKVDFKSKDLLIYCTDSFLDKTTTLLESMNAGYRGLFESSDIGRSYISEISFRRGMYSIHLINKPVSKSIIVGAEEIIENKIVVFCE